MNLFLLRACLRRPGPRALLALAPVLACACSSDPRDEAVAIPDLPSWAKMEVGEEAQPGTLELVSDEQLQLGVGEESLIRVRLIGEDGEPRPGARVSFALIGQPQDAGLEELDADTDDMGVAENKLITGKMATTFAVRVSSPGAEDISISVGVSGEGFGAMRVSVPYDGNRSVAQRIVFAQASMKCGHPERMTGVPLAVIDEDTDDALLTSIPAGVSFAVVVLAESRANTIVAQGCSDGVRVKSDQELQLNVQFMDEPFKPVGQFGVKVELDAEAPARTLASALESAAEELVNTDAEGESSSENSEARFMLDSLDQTLREAPFSEQSSLDGLADALIELRAETTMPTALFSLQEALDARSTGPLVAIPRIADVVQTSLEELTLFAALTLDPANAGEPVVWQARRIQARPTVYGGSPPSIDLALLRVAADSMAYFLAKKDMLQLLAVSFRAELGALAAEVLPRAVAAVSISDADYPDPYGCLVLGDWLGQQELMQAAACAADCLRATCERVMERITESANTALLALDEERPNLTLRGNFHLLDENGDLLADTMEAEKVSGEWYAESGENEDPIGGHAEATAITGASQLP